MTAGERSGSLTSEAFPHNYLEDALEFEIVSVEFETTDKESVTEDAVQIVNSDRRISLVQASGWNKTIVSGLVTVPEKIFNATLPFNERDRPPVKLILAVRCSKTILRMGEVGTTSSVEISEPGEYELEAALSYDDVRGDVVLKPYLV